MILFKDADALIHPDNILDDVQWRDVLRWMLAAMDADDSSLSFVSGCLSYITKTSGDGRLTDRQIKGVQKTFNRLRADFINEQLDCQNIHEVV